MTFLSRTYCIAFLATILTATSAVAQPATGVVSGTVSFPAPDGQPVVVPGVTLTLTCVVGEPRSGVSNEQGQFRFADVPAGPCSIVAELSGFKSAAKAIVARPDEPTDVTLRLDLEALHEEVNVTARADTGHDAAGEPFETDRRAVCQCATCQTRKYQGGSGDHGSDPDATAHRLPMWSVSIRELFAVLMVF